MAEEAKGNAVVVDAEVTKLTLDADACPVQSVTVFVDRAEVTRLVTVDLEEAGDYEVVVEGLTSCVDADSVRVDGTGHVILREVSFGVHHKPVVDVEQTDHNGNNPEVIRQNLKKLQHEISELQTRVSEVSRSQELLNAYAKSVLNARASETNAETMAAGMEVAFALLDRQQAKNKEFNAEKARLQEQVEAKNKLVAVAQQRLNSIGAHLGGRTKISRDVTVVLQATQSGEAQLRMMYMVSNASWTPAYDARITTSDTNLALTYYGMVKQTTGESWNNTKLILSTATPSVGGTAPILPTKHVGFYNPVAQHQQDYSSLRSSAAPRRHMRRGGDRSFAAPQMMNLQAHAFGGLESAPAPPPPAATVATSTVDNTGAATTFTVQRRTTIASDNKPHKVTVAMLSLPSSFRHYSVPALNAVAYLQCLTTNNSEYTLLASPQVNVFLDGSFVSKTKLNNVAPNEKFRTFLGVDNGVKVEYRTLSNVHRERGYFSKVEDTVYKYMTTVKNATGRDIRMVVADMLPVSDDATIKVKLIQPTREEVDAGSEMERKERAGAGAEGGDAGAGGADIGDAVAQVKLTNNLVWTRNIAAGRSIEIPFHYSVEHPGGRNVLTYNRAQGQ